MKFTVYQTTTTTAGEKYQESHFSNRKQAEHFIKYCEKWYENNLDNNIIRYEIRLVTE